MKGCESAWIDETLHELTAHGSAQFPFQYYNSYYDQNDKPGFPWHWHRDVEIVYARKGEANCLVGGQRIVLRRGEGLFIQSGVIHGYDVPQSAELPTLLFKPELIAPERSTLYTKFVEPLLLRGLSHAVLRPSIPWQAELLDNVRSLCTLAGEKSPTMELDAHAGVCGIWSLLYRHQNEITSLDRTENASQTQARLRRMIRFLEEHYNERICLNDVAKSASVSVSEALRCFRNGVQTTPMDYLNRYRLNCACSRLTATSLSVTEIAAECGFSGAAYFDRVFRRQYGENPTAYRNRRDG